MNKTILIVDDESSILRLLGEHFREVGFNVLEAESAVEALEKIDFKQVDCLITDIIMPELDGVQFVSKLQEKKIFPPLFFITGYSDYPREKLNALKPKAIIFKPFDLDELTDLVRLYVK